MERAERSKGSAASTDWEPAEEEEEEREGEGSWGLGLVFLQTGEVVKGRSGGGLAMGCGEVMVLLRFHSIPQVCRGLGCMERKPRC